MVSTPKLACSLTIAACIYSSMLCAQAHHHGTCNRILLHPSPACPPPQQAQVKAEPEVKPKAKPAARRGGARGGGAKKAAAVKEEPVVAGEGQGEVGEGRAPGVEDATGGLLQALRRRGQRGMSRCGPRCGPCSTRAAACSQPQHGVLLCSRHHLVSYWLPPLQPVVQEAPAPAARRTRGKRVVVTLSFEEEEEEVGSWCHRCAHVPLTVSGSSEQRRVRQTPGASLLVLLCCFCLAPARPLLYPPSLLPPNQIPPPPPAGHAPAHHTAHPRPEGCRCTCCWAGGRGACRGGQKGAGATLAQEAWGGRRGRRVGACAPVSKQWCWMATARAQQASSHLRRQQPQRRPRFKRWQCCRGPATCISDTFTGGCSRELRLGALRAHKA